MRCIGKRYGSSRNSEKCGHSRRKWPLTTSMRWWSTKSGSSCPSAAPAATACPVKGVGAGARMCAARVTHVLGIRVPRAASRAKEQLELRLCGIE